MREDRSSQNPQLPQGEPIIPLLPSRPATNQLPEEVHEVLKRPDPLFPLPQTLPPGGTFGQRFPKALRTDRSYLIFLLALVLAIISGFILINFVTSIYAQITTPAMQHEVMPQDVKVTPAGTIDIRPTFPPPSGGKGSNESSQPSGSSSGGKKDISLQGKQSLHILDLPSSVQGGTTVTVHVTGGEPNTDVKLLLDYGAQSTLSVSAAQTFQADGSAQLTWHVPDLQSSSAVSAHITAIGQDQSGATVISQTVEIQII
ncbi:hypothetical protein EPA93_35450 [Ktedonosporobacter rubrisoli]|uniref:Uncharacterized protein n=1 Tax=Ktedonosporobacter rubrisoli TaxID=2509675 RepID=A0A4P6JZQ0_KTERU|nr:hypothetical protein [Ktedonosporobacter rubrisoli]QBD80983.1 hypothetical protein EPA93_35450 [Ktedonosporobacter rubrisoli]